MFVQYAPPAAAQKQRSPLEAGLPREDARHGGGFEAQCEKEQEQKNNKNCREPGY